MRRLLVAVGSIAALALAGVLAAGVGARTVERAPAVSRQKPPVLKTGSSCYVSIARCSQTPCTVFIGSVQAAVYAPTLVAPRFAPPPASKRCARMHLPRTSLAANHASRVPPAVAIGPALMSRLPALAHRLAIRHP